MFLQNLQLEIIICSFLFWFLLFKFSLKTSFYLKTYQKLSNDKQTEWSFCVVSIVSSFFQVFVLITLFNDPMLVFDKLLGSSYYSTLAISISTGYYLFDFISCCFYYKIYGIEMFIHSICGLVWGLLSMVK